MEACSCNVIAPAHDYESHRSNDCSRSQLRRGLMRFIGNPPKPCLRSWAVSEDRRALKRRPEFGQFIRVYNDEQDFRYARHYAVGVNETGIDTEGRWFGVHENNSCPLRQKLFCQLNDALVGDVIDERV